MEDYMKQIMDKSKQIISDLQIVDEWYGKTENKSYSCEKDEEINKEIIEKIAPNIFSMKGVLLFTDFLIILRIYLSFFIITQ
jgi:hypothetical protein